jgi:aryl-alcohol dehydrogenase-like predicted oxidoreductase
VESARRRLPERTIHSRIPQGRRQPPSGVDILPTNEDLGFALVEEMRGMAQERGASVAQVAIAWLLSKRAVTSVLLGSSKRSQLYDNLSEGHRPAAHSE